MCGVPGIKWGGIPIVGPKVFLWKCISSGFCTQGLCANGNSSIHCSSPSAAANPKLSLNGILNRKARAIRMMRYKGPFCSPLELLGDRKQNGERKGKKPGPILGNISFPVFHVSTKPFFLCVCICFPPSLAWLKFRRIIELFVFVFRTAWTWECFPFVGIK